MTGIFLKFRSACPWAVYRCERLSDNEIFAVKTIDKALASTYNFTFAIFFFSLNALKGYLLLGVFWYIFYKPINQRSFMVIKLPISACAAFSRADPQTVALLRLEAEILQSLDHPHIVQVIDFFEADDMRRGLSRSPTMTKF